MDTLQGRKWLNFAEAAQDRGLDAGYFRNQIKEGRGPSYIKTERTAGVLHQAGFGSLDSVVEGGVEVMSRYNPSGVEDPSIEEAMRRYDDNSVRRDMERAI